MTHGLANLKKKIIFWHFAVELSSMEKNSENHCFVAVWGVVLCLSLLICN
jgi:hypothetical protein